MAELLSRILGFLFVSAVVWMPLLLLLVLWLVWVRYLRMQTIADKEFMLIEVQLPKKVYRSPLAMELFLNVLHDRGSTPSWINKYIFGKIVPWWSLEIASFGGDIHFYIWTERQFRHLVESQIYSQYPDAEITEATDYTRAIEYDEDQYTMWATEWRLLNPDPYPLKTYIDYGMDKDPDEEVKIDPLTPLLEFMGSMQQGEQFWTQIILRMHLPDGDRKRGTLIGKTDQWIDDAHDEIEKIKQQATIERGEDGGTQMALTPGQRATIEAIERSTSKLPFDVGMRSMYIATQDTFRNANIPGMISAFRQFGSYDLNTLKPARSTGFDYPWEDFRDFRVSRMKRTHFEGYRRRSYFYPPIVRPTKMILNTEELATLYHFPGEVATTPTFKRIDSRKAEPPSNLPF